MHVFLSYRREDSAGYAGRICEHLSAVFGSERVFMDVEDIAPGQDFAKAIEATISASQAVVVVIGPGWASELKRRNGGEDFVREEVAAALRRNIMVIPVLVGGATMPSATDLPGEVSALSRRHALEIRAASFEEDAKLLAAALQKAPGLAQRQRHALPKQWAWILAAAALLVAMTSFAVRWSEAARFDISGTWIAEMKKPNQRPYQVRLEFAGGSGTVTGSVGYPTGDAGIQAGALESGRLTFFTVHVPQFASEAATIRWSGVVDEGSIRFTAADDHGVASGIAHRSP